jgi:hypothetical protein
MACDINHAGGAVLTLSLVVQPQRLGPGQVSHKAVWQQHWNSELGSDH